MKVDKLRALYLAGALGNILGLTPSHAQNCVFGGWPSHLAAVVAGLYLFLTAGKH